MLVLWRKQVNGTPRDRPGRGTCPSRWSPSCWLWRWRRHRCTTPSPGGSGSGATLTSLSCTPIRPGRCGTATRAVARSTSRAAPRCSTCAWQPPLRAASPWSSCFPIRVRRCCWPRSASPGRTARSRGSLSCMRPSPGGTPTAGRSAAARCRLACWPNSPRQPGSKAPCCTSLTTARRSACCAWCRTPNGISSPTLPTGPSWPSGRAGHAIGRAYPTARLAPAPLTVPRRSAISRPGGPGRPATPGSRRPGQLAVLSVRSGGRADWLRAGQALQRVLLTATDRGIAVTPLTQPLETADAWLVRDPRSATEQPQMILRIGYGLPVPPTPRRPVTEVLDEPRPGKDPSPGTRAAD